MKTQNDLRTTSAPAAQKTSESSSKGPRKPLTPAEIDALTPEQAREQLAKLMGRTVEQGEMFRKPAVWPPAPETLPPTERQLVEFGQRYREQHAPDGGLLRALDELVLDSGRVVGNSAHPAKVEEK